MKLQNCVKLLRNCYTISASQTSGTRIVLLDTKCEYEMSRHHYRVTKPRGYRLGLASVHGQYSGRYL